MQWVEPFAQRNIIDREYALKYQTMEKKLYKTAALKAFVIKVRGTLS